MLGRTIDLIPYRQAGRMRFTVLGSVAVVLDDERHTMRRAQTRGLLALLLLHVGRRRTRGWPSFLAAALRNLGQAYAGRDDDAVDAAWREAKEIYRRLGKDAEAAAVRALLAVPPAETHPPQ